MGQNSGFKSYAIIDIAFRGRRAGDGIGHKNRRVGGNKSRNAAAGITNVGNFDHRAWTDLPLN
jgi:hypothetical protein